MQRCYLLHRLRMRLECPSSPSGRTGQVPPARRAVLAPQQPLASQAINTPAIIKQTLTWRPAAKDPRLASEQRPAPNSSGPARGPWGPATTATSPSPHGGAAGPGRSHRGRRNSLWRTSRPWGEGGGLLWDPESGLDLPEEEGWETAGHLTWGCTRLWVTVGV